MRRSDYELFMEDEMIKGRDTGISTRTASIALALLLVSACGNCLASDRWRYVGETAEFEVQMDFDTFEREGDFATAWFEYRYFKPTDVSRHSMLVRIDCVKRTRQELSGITYDQRGRVSHSSNQPLGRAHIVPDTAGELSWGAACPEEATPLGRKRLGAKLDELMRGDAQSDRRLSEISSYILVAQERLPPTLWADVVEFEWKNRWPRRAEK